VYALDNYKFVKYSTGTAAIVCMRSGFWLTSRRTWSQSTVIILNWITAKFLMFCTQPVRSARSCSQLCSCRMSQSNEVGWRLCPGNVWFESVL